VIGPPVAPVFAKAMRNYQRGLMGIARDNFPGAAVEPAHDTLTAEQAFGSAADGFCSSQDSRLLWRADTRQIYFLVAGNSGLHMDECVDTWKLFPDTWHAGDLDNEDLSAPPGRFVPHLGIGHVWRQQFYDGQTYPLGFASAPEKSRASTMQRFEHALAFYFPDNQTFYILFDQFRYVTRGGDATGRLWFQVE
jgi:hypothetical protein